MNDLQIFNSPEFGTIRTTVIDGEPWFVGKDVADVLEYNNSRDALAKRVDDEDKGVAKCDTLGGVQDLVVINESGLYSLIFASHLPKSKPFKRWVTSEVLPTIRKTGRYETQDSKRQRLISEASNILENASDEVKPYLKALLDNKNFNNVDTNYSGRLIITSDEEIAALDRAIEAYSTVYNYYRSGGSCDIKELHDYDDIATVILNTAKYLAKKPGASFRDPSLLSFTCAPINKDGTVRVPKVGTFAVEPEIVLDITERPSMGYIRKHEDGSYTINIRTRSIWTHTSTKVTNT